MQEKHVELEKKSMVRSFTPEEQQRLSRARTLDRPKLGWEHGAASCPGGGCCVWKTVVAI